MRRRFIRVIAIFGLLAAFIPTLTLQPALAAGVVGDGSPASCTEAAFDAKLAGGGLVTFNCGPGITTINLTSEKVIANNTQIDGNNFNRARHAVERSSFQRAACATFQLSRIQLENGSASAQGGSILNAGTTITDFVVIRESYSQVRGGAISNTGTLTLLHTVLSLNVADGPGAGIFTLGGVVTVDQGSRLISNGSHSNGRGGGSTTAEDPSLFKVILSF